MDCVAEPLINFGEKKVVAYSEPQGGASSASSTSDSQSSGRSHIGFSRKTCHPRPLSTVCAASKWRSGGRRMCTAYNDCVLPFSAASISSNDSYTCAMPNFWASARAFATARSHTATNSTRPNRLQAQCVPVGDIARAQQCDAAHGLRRCSFDRLGLQVLCRLRCHLVRQLSLCSIIVGAWPWKRRQ